MIIRKYFLVFLFLISIIFVNAFIPPIHNANEILIEVDEVEMSLQNASDEGFLKDWVMGASEFFSEDYNKTKDRWHSGNDIQIYLGTRHEEIAIGKISLQEAISQGKSFCRDAPGIFGWLIGLGHSADEIIFNDGETFQEKINTQQFCSYEWKNDDVNWEGECVTINAIPECGIGKKYRNVWCDRSDGETDVDEIFCNDDSFALEENRPLEEDPCEEGDRLECGWGGWGDTSPCSEPCVQGTWSRVRTCLVDDFCQNGDNSRSSGGGVCEVGGVDCGWNDYGDTSTCSAVCNGGTFGQSRTCKYTGADATNHCTNAYPLSSGGGTCNDNIACHQEYYWRCGLNGPTIVLDVFTSQGGGLLLRTDEDRCNCYVNWFWKGECPDGWNTVGTPFDTGYWSSCRVLCEDPTRVA